MTENNKTGVTGKKIMITAAFLLLSIGSIAEVRNYVIMKSSFDIPKDIYNKAKNNERFHDFKMAVKCNDATVKFPSYKSMGQFEGNYGKFCGAEVDHGYWVFIKPYLIVWQSRLDGDNYTDYMKSKRERENYIKNSSSKRQGYMTDIMRNSCVENCIKSSCRGYTMERTIKPCADSCRVQCK